MKLNTPKLIVVLVFAGLVIGAAGLAGLARKADRPHIRMRKIDQRGPVETLVLENATGRVIRTEAIGLIEESAAGIRTNLAWSGVNFIDAGSNQVVRVVESLFVKRRRLLVYYRLEPRPWEVRLRKWGAAVKVCSPYSQAELKRQVWPPEERH